MSSHWHDDEYVRNCPCDEESPCICGHDLNRHDMGHGCIECRCRRFEDAPRTPPCKCSHARSQHTLGTGQCWSSACGCSTFREKDQ